MFGTHYRPIVLCCALMSCSVAFAQAKPEQATTEMVAGDPHGVHPGEELVFKVRLNEPLPTDAQIQLRIRPASSVTQEYILGSSQTNGPDHKELLVKFTLPETTYPGDWKTNGMYLILAGSSFSSFLQANELKFVVVGKPYAIPTSATVTLENH